MKKIPLLTYIKEYIATEEQCTCQHIHESQDEASSTSFLMTTWPAYLSTTFSSIIVLVIVFFPLLTITFMKITYKIPFAF